MAHDLTEMIYAAVHTPDHWSAVAPKIARWLSTPTVICAIGTTEAGSERCKQIPMATGPGVDRLIDLVGCMDADAHLVHYPPDLAISSLSLQNDQGLGEWLHISGAVRGAPHLCHVIAARMASESPFTEGDAERFSSLARHLIRATSLGAARSASFSEPLWEEAIDRMSIGVLVIDGDGRFIRANVEGRRLLTGARQVGLVNGRLRPFQSEKAAEFQELLAKLACGELDRTAMLMSDGAEESGDILLGLVGALLTDSAVAQKGASHIFAYISEVDKDLPRLEGLLRQAFQLTRMEAKTTIAILRGMGVDEAARTLGLGPSTVRTHVKNVYSKTGVQRQSQLVHRALGGALTLLA